MKTTLVTGGSRSIGGAISRKLASDGYAVAVHARTDRPSVHEFVRSLPGTSHIAVFGDIADPDEANDVVGTTVKQLGHLDLLVNNAGIYAEGAIDKQSSKEWQDQWRDIFATNVFGTTNVTFAAVNHFLTRPSGPAGTRILSIGSRGAYRGEPDAPAYGASKSAIHSLTQSLAVSLAPHGIAVAAVAPGFTDTELTHELLASEAGDQIRKQSPFGRVGTPQEIASAVSWLASSDALWASGAILDMNGASHLR